MGLLLNKETISFRCILSTDIESIVNYWHHSPPGFLEGMGVDPQKISSPEDMRVHLQGQVDDFEKNGSKVGRLLIIEYLNGAIGCHNLNEIAVGDSALFHAHIWDYKMRGQGLGSYTYPRACRIYMDRFNLKKIRFISPTLNKGINQIKEKLRLKCLGEVEMTAPILIKGTRGYIYELTKEHLIDLGF